MIIGIAANAFKGSLSAVDASHAMAKGFELSRLHGEVRQMPLADGGDGTLDVLLSQPGSQRHTLDVKNPLGEPVRADYGTLDNGKTAIIEMALGSGLALIENRLNPMQATTYGTGQLINHAIEQGAKRIIVGVGGSATVDGGAGCLQAMGVQLLGKEGNPIGYGGGALKNLARVEMNPHLKDIEIQVLCDVDNPTLGEKGAAAIFAPQKGASPEQVALLEEYLTHFFTVIAEQTEQDVRTLKGGGAAGALSAGLAALAGATLVPGAETLIEALHYEALLKNCHLVVTGEGKLDTQTAHGKAPAVIAQLAKKYDIPAIALAGSIPDVETLAGSSIAAAFSCVPQPVTLEQAMQKENAEKWLRQTAQNIGNLLALFIIKDIRA